MVDPYTVHRYDENLKCEGGYRPGCREWYTVEYKDFPSPEFNTEAEALYYILEREGITVRNGYE